MVVTLRRLLVAAGLLFRIVGGVHAQPGGSASKVTWTVQGDTLAPGRTGAVPLQASIAEGWKMYAPASPPPTVGVAVSSVESTPTGVKAATDSLLATGAATAYDPNFDKDVHFFSGTARLRLPVTLPAGVQPGAHSLRGTLRFMVCTTEICLPPATESFEATVVVTN